MGHSGVAEHLIEHRFGCGRFQIIIVIFLYWLTTVPSMLSFMMMSFGSYNPGWRCLDEIVSSDLLNGTGIHKPTFQDSNVSSGIMKNQSNDYSTEYSCKLFENCQHIEFNPDTSTIISEFSLLCDRAWIPNIIVSIQMFGILVGSMIAGQLADSIGRKASFFGAILLNAFVNFILLFSVNWVMLAVLRFFIGFISACLLSLFVVYPSEFVPEKWRAPLPGFPAWSTAGMIFGAITMALKDWRNFQIVVCILFILCFLPVFWFPESIRWLEVKNKPKQFRKVAKKIANMNGMKLPPIDTSKLLTQEKSELSGGGAKVSLLSIFRKGYRLYSIVIGFQWFSLSVIYYAVSFGLKNLSGSFYVNFTLISAVAIPFAIFPIVAPRFMGRKISLFVCHGTIAVFLGAATCFELLATGSVKDIGTVTCVVLAVAGNDIAWSLVLLVTMEIYPTVSRGVGMGWGGLMARAGGIVAPFIIPVNKSNIYIWYAVMGGMAIICCCLVSVLPETKGKPLKETIESERSSDIDSSVILSDTEIMAHNELSA